MSNPNYTNDILKSLELNSMNGMFFPMPYPDSDSCFRYERKPNGSIIKYVNIVSSSMSKPCPHCGCIDRHDSKGIRKIFLTHTSNGHLKTILEVTLEGTNASIAINISRITSLLDSLILS